MGRHSARQRVANSGRPTVVKIVTPVYPEHLPVRFLESRDATMMSAELEQRGIRVLWKCVRGCSDVGLARATGLDDAISDGIPFTHLAFIDADTVGWGPQHVIWALEARQECVTGWCLGSPDRNGNARLSFRLKNPLEECGSLLELDWSGLPFMLVARSALEKAIAAAPKIERQGRRVAHPFLVHINDAGGLVSEDVAFCRLLQATGTKIWLDRRIRLGHLKPIPIEADPSVIGEAIAASEIGHEVFVRVARGAQ